ncbi:hypothetical protein [Actinomyces ruminicola]|uniref:hypothetical protein n=1 Tax=Actinomyces ruminicola TaxID=332524 RepID=UPI0011C9A66D|nr:hypothetical protein [Actinomyces ruminicola]
MTTYKLVRPVGASLPEAGSLRREPPRPVEKRDPTYADNYDDSTVFYDAILSGRTITLVGPPLLNLEGFITGGDVRFGAAEDPVRFSTVKHDRSQVSTVRLRDPGMGNAELKFRLSDGTRLALTPTPDMNELFAGRRVLMAHQKDEPIAWILDWIRYYQHEHGVDAVLLYDNASTTRTPEELLGALRSLEGLQTAVVVEWNYKFGPQGSPWVGPNVAWDSDYGQIGAFQDARYRFLQSAVGVINSDIDELVIKTTDMDVFDALAESEDGVVGYGGRWIENSRSDTSRTPRFWDFFKILKTGHPCRPKWTARYSSLSSATSPTCHFIRGADVPPDDRFYLAHFRGLNMGWKVPKRLQNVEDRGQFAVDYGVVGALAEVFPDSIPWTEVRRALKEVSRATPVDGDRVFREWLQEAVRARCGVPGDSWTRSWFWRSNVGVLERDGGRLGRIAFDLEMGANAIGVALSVRDGSHVDDLHEALASSGIQVMGRLSGGMGFRLREFDRKESREELAEEIAALLTRCVRAVSGE